MTGENLSPQAFKILENVVFLKKTPLFSSMRTHDLRAVAAVVEELTFEPGEEVVREGDVGDALFLIKEGNIRIAKKVGENNSVDLAEIGEGECFGDMAVFDAELRSASAFAKGRTVVLRLDGEDLIDVIVECPYIAIEFLKMFVKRLRKANEAAENLTKKTTERTRTQVGAKPSER
jgi:CRP-like cAMP-binding protein